MVHCGLYDTKKGGVMRGQFLFCLDIYGGKAATNMRNDNNGRLEHVPLHTPPLLNDGRAMVPPGRVRHREALHREDEGLLIKPLSLLSPDDRKGFLHDVRLNVLNLIHLVARTVATEESRDLGRRIVLKGLLAQILLELGNAERGALLRRSQVNRLLLGQLL